MTTEPAQNQPNVTEAHRLLYKELFNEKGEPEWCEHWGCRRISAAEARAVEVATKDLKQQIQDARETFERIRDLCGMEKTDPRPAESGVVVVTAKLALAERDLADSREDRAILFLQLIDAKESAARSACHTRKVERDHNGQVAGTFVTDSGAMSDRAELLRELAEAFRFRIVAEAGRMVVGYWPENDPSKKDAAMQPEGGK